MITQATDDEAALTVLEATAPTEHAGLARQTCSVEEQGSGIWDGDARYAAVSFGGAPPVGSAVYTFSTMGGTQHVTQSLATIRKAPSGAPSCNGAIGVTRDGVDGVDLTVPVYAWEETHVLSDAAVTSAYRQLIYGLTGAVNAATWREYAAGTVLFRGARGSQLSTGNWKLSYAFAASPNVTDWGPSGLTVRKDGWEYAWVRYQDAAGDGDAFLTQTPVAVYVEQVYRSGSFADLGIG